MNTLQVKEVKVIKSGYDKYLKILTSYKVSESMEESITCKHILLAVDNNNNYRLYEEDMNEYLRELVDDAITRYTYDRMDGFDITVVIKAVKQCMVENNILSGCLVEIDLSDMCEYDGYDGTQDGEFVDYCTECGHVIDSETGECHNCLRMEEQECDKDDVHTCPFYIPAFTI